MEFLRSFLRCHLAGKPVAASPNVGCFLRLKCNVVQLCLAENEILLMRKWNHAFLPLASALVWKMTDRFIKKQTRWSNNKTSIELGYRKISWFVSVPRINYAHHWQIPICCSTSSKKLLNVCTNHTKERLPFIRIDRPRPGHSRCYETEYTFYNQNYTGRQISKILNSKHVADGFYAKTLGKPISLSMTGPTMVQPASSDFWKAPQVLILYCENPCKWKYFICMWNFDAFKVLAPTRNVIFLLWLQEPGLVKELLAKSQL